MISRYPISPLKSHEFFCCVSIRWMLLALQSSTVASWRHWVRFGPDEFYGPTAAYGCVAVPWRCNLEKDGADGCGTKTLPKSKLDPKTLAFGKGLSFQVKVGILGVHVSFWGSNGWWIGDDGKQWKSIDTALDPPFTQDSHHQDDMKHFLGSGIPT